MVYDYQGRRVRKLVSNWNGSSWAPETTKYFVYDGWNVVEEQTVSQPSKYYVWGLDLSQSLQGAGGIGGLLARVESTTTHNFLYDGNGNVTQLINATTGTTDAHYEYDPYGNTIVATGAQAAGNPYRFSTKYLDGETGLYYYGHRHYSPDLGRWTSRDPAEEFGGGNLYRFVANNSITNIDFLGLWIPKEVKEEIYKIIVDIGNLAEGLPRRLLRNYMFGDGKEFKLTKAEVLFELKPKTSLYWDENFVKDIVSNLRSGNRSFMKKYNLPSITDLSGSLGNFTTVATVQVQCLMERLQVSYSATGTAKIKDQWDFDWKLWEYIKGRLGQGLGNGRTWYGQWRTMVGSTIPGKSFDVTSEELDVQQSIKNKILIFK